MANELEGLELPEESSVDGVFFHGVAEPFAGTIPGKTETGFADTLAVSDWTGILAAACAGARFRGGGGGAAGLAFGGASSK